MKPVSFGPLSTALRLVAAMVARGRLIKSPGVHAE